MNRKTVDVIIIGGGAGGLTAAMYLARFNRSVILFDDNQSRMRWIGKTHNYPTYEEGISGEEILKRLKSQAIMYGAGYKTQRVTSVEPSHDQFLVTTTHQGEWQAKAVILATGVKDRLPPLREVHAAMRNGIVQVCPVCHAYESNGKKVAILSDSSRGLKEAEFLLRYAAQVALLDISKDGISVTNHHIQHHRVKTEDIALEPDTCSISREGSTISFDHLYIALGKEPANELAKMLGVRLTEGGCIPVDAFQETSVRNVFAVGDIVKGLDQIVVAQAEGAIAASHLNLRLSEECKNADEHMETPLTKKG